VHDSLRDAIILHSQWLQLHNLLSVSNPACLSCITCRKLLWLAAASIYGQNFIHIILKAIGAAERKGSGLRD